ncbi:PRC-barrel domain containing protein [Methylobacterium nigriterrae]|uniref:PRC-barrel domain containing protein n=1 Tax=Methylobacterium nigriterrae TaxID=3127512 RepID=UPI003013F5BC
MQQHVRTWACALVMLAGTASAQEARSPLVARADARMQLGAASLVPTLRGRWLYANDKLVVGRVQDVRVSQDGTTLIAVVARRRWLGGGEIGIPVPHLHQFENDLTVSGTRESIRQIPLLKP